MPRPILPLSRPSLILLAALATPHLDAQEHRLKRSELPAAVERTLEAQTSQATIKGFSTEREKGKTVYEAKRIVAGRTRDLQIAADGTLTEIEEEVPFAALPPAVQAALSARAAGARIIKVESLTRHGTLFAYEAATLKGAKKREIKVGPDGFGLSHPR